MSAKIAEYIDRGFDSDFSRQRIGELCGLFGSDTELQEFIDRIHEADNAFDMKRGEFYPEILRAIMSLKRAAASSYGIEPSQVHPNFGSNGSIDTIMMAIKLREMTRNLDARKEGGVLVTSPTYFRNYNSAASKQLRLVKVPLEEPGWNLDLPQMLETTREEKPSAIFLVTPNNPTGLASPDDAIHSIIQEADKETLVVIDRTLANTSNEVPTDELLKKYAHKQVVVLHSFSKYAGMSHLRVGLALYSNPQIAEEIRPLLPLGLGLEGAVKATRYLLSNRVLRPSDHILNNIRTTKQVLAAFVKDSRHYACSDFVGNYCLLILRDGLTSQVVDERLRSAGIYAMGGHDFPEPRNDLIRLHTGGDANLMEKTVEVLKQISG
jgi:histidinol-phosphate/aromatic aminotransferase/cobyric acid decarboxylase-like protein